MIRVQQVPYNIWRRPDIRRAYRIIRRVGPWSSSRDRAAMCVCVCVYNNFSCVQELEHTPATTMLIKAPYVQKGVLAPCAFSHTRKPYTFLAHTHSPARTHITAVIRINDNNIAIPLYTSPQRVFVVAPYVLRARPVMTEIKNKREEYSARAHTLTHILYRNLPGQWVGRQVPKDHLLFTRRVHTHTHTYTYVYTLL